MTDLSRRSMLSLGAATTTTAALSGLVGATSAEAASPLANKMYWTMLSAVGKPYVWGASGPNAFDCSGLIQWAARQNGVVIPHWTEDQIYRCGRIRAKSGRSYLSTVSRYAGVNDLIYYYDAKGVSKHVGLYIGSGRILNARTPGTRVRTDGVSNFSYSRAQVFTIS